MKTEEFIRLKDNNKVRIDSPYDWDEFPEWNEYMRHLDGIILDKKLFGNINRLDETVELNGYYIAINWITPAITTVDDLNNSMFV